MIAIVQRHDRTNDARARALGENRSFEFFLLFLGGTRGMRKTKHGFRPLRRRRWRRRTGRGHRQKDVRDGRRMRHNWTAVGRILTGARPTVFAGRVAAAARDGRPTRPPATRYPRPRHTR